MTTSQGRSTPATPTGPAWFMANELLAFVVEVAALAALAWWGIATEDAVASRVLLGVGAPAAAAVVWGLFAAPRARIRLPLVGVLLVKAVVLGCGVYAVHAVGHSGAAVLFGVVAVVNTGLAETFRRRLNGGAAD
ncbi:YrdB family protein [Streptomyces sp. JV185]|uniref:YrdB family protein n=1 Tax=Streptomyces sp. JV185 TaxID=858638 RepID=UPI002E77B374|nr:YrdB family protein [Streptomyces sp. JV185]MEE1772862.1 YrdB family protein [Streptomyces sp. JV185]